MSTSTQVRFALPAVLILIGSAIFVLTSTPGLSPDPATLAPPPLCSYEFLDARHKGFAPVCPVRPWHL